jgi:putative DNA primase/helicase
MIDLPEIEDQCFGRWTQILRHIGIEEKYLSGKHSECPLCGNGKDTYRWDKTKEFMFCGYCGNKGGMGFVMSHLGMSFKDAAAHIRENILGLTKMEIPKAAQGDYGLNRDRLDKIKAGCVKITSGDPVDRYLKNRGIGILPEGAVMYHPAVDYWQDGVKIGTYPAMVAALMTNNLERVTYKITYLTMAGEKADVPVQKKLMPVEREINGAAVRMFRVTDTLAVAEGIETALKYTEDAGIPCWSCDTAGNMEKFIPPDGVKNVVIVADSDENFTGYVSAFTLAKRLKAKGFVVNVVMIIKAGGKFEYHTEAGHKMDYLDYSVGAAA